MSVQTHDLAPLVLPRRQAVVGLVPAIPGRRRLDWQVKYVAALVGFDAFAFLVAGGAAVLARFGDPAAPLGTLPYWAVVPLTLPVWLALLSLSGAYELHVVGRGTSEYKRVFDASLRLCAVVALVTLFLKVDLARSIVLATLPLSCVGAIALRGVARHVLAGARAHGRALQRVLVIGHESSAFAMAARLSLATKRSFDVVGVCAPDGSDRRHRVAPHDGVDRRRRPHDVQVVGTIEDVPTLVRELDAHAIVVSPSPAMSAERLRQLAWDVENVGVEMLVAPALIDVAGPRIHVSPVEGQPLLHVQTPRLAGARAFVKSSFDRVTASVALLLLLPVLAIVVFLIKRESAGPALFRQVRVGKGGQTFTIYKLRSMYADADARAVDLWKHNTHKAGPLFKMDDDPRITPIGRHLRRWSIDELPQLLNVALGHMSLVGPRPPLPSEVDRYEVSHIYRRLMVRPGLTGLWQVSGRADLDWTETVRLDLYYVENWSLTMDLGILWKTLGAVLMGRGAC